MFGTDPRALHNNKLSRYYATPDAEPYQSSLGAIKGHLFATCPRALAARRCP
jgi:hypothetical protein